VASAVGTSLPIIVLKILWSDICITSLYVDASALIK